MPKISVVVPCYHQAQYLDECLQSVLDQTYTDWECIVVNDGSTDSTEDIAKKWTAKDPRFKYLYKENGGLSSARNAGIEMAEGEWILPLDADDKIDNQYLELAEKEFEKDYTVVYCEAEFFGEKTGKWELPEFSLQSLAQKNCIFCSAFYKKEDWQKVNGYDVNMIYGLEDYEFWVAMLKNKKDTSAKKINKICFYYRMKENSMVMNLKNERSKKMLDYISIKHTEFFVAQLGNFQALAEEINFYEKKLLEIKSSKRYQLLNSFLNFFEKK